MALSLTVDVPDVLGVPNVLFSAASSLASGGLVALTSDLLGDVASFGAQWGIFSGGMPVVIAETVTSLSYRQEYAISTFPVERGGFESYNKVAIPFEARIRFAAGSLMMRDAMIASIAAIIGDTKTYDVVTPETVYQSVNVKRQEYDRSAQRGLGLLQVEVHVEEIRQTANLAAGTTSGTAAPDGAAPAPGGTVQSTTASPAARAADQTLGGAMRSALQSEVAALKASIAALQASIAAELSALTDLQEYERTESLADVFGVPLD